MYTEIGQVSEVTVSELRDMLGSIRWEVVISKVTHHQAAPCGEQLKTVREIVDRWSIDTWNVPIFLRLGPGGNLYRHSDEGFGYHVPVETNERAVSVIYANGIKKEQHLEVGKVYSIDRSIEHESFNNGETDRTHLIMLLKTEGT